MASSARGAGLALICLAMAGLAGCTGGGGKGPPKLGNTVPVTGVVTMDGNPLAGATVTFHPEDAAGFQGAMGVTNAEGKYELETLVGNGEKKKGALPGKYKVTVNRLIKPDGSTVEFDPKTPPMNIGANESMPMRYISASSTPFSQEVGASGGTIDLPCTMAE